MEAPTLPLYKGQRWDLWALGVALSPSRASKSHVLGAIRRGWVDIFHREIRR